MLPKVRFLAVCDRMVYQREPVVELLRILHPLRQVKCVRMHDGDWRTREGCRRARDWTDEFDMSSWSCWA